MDNGREVLIRVKGLAKSFGGYQIWDGLNLDVYRGEILAIVGGSGQGKSVLLRVITGLVKPDAGEVELFGHNAKSLSAKDRIDIESRWGILFQDGALFSSLTVLQNIQVPMREHLELPAGDHGRSRLPQDRHGRAAARGGAQIPVRALRRHAQARRA